MATAVDEAGFDGCVEVMGKGTGEVMVMNVEVEDDDDDDNKEDDETVALVEAEGASIILKLPLLNAPVVLPGRTITNLKSFSDISVSVSTVG